MIKKIYILLILFLIVLLPTSILKIANSPTEDNKPSFSINLLGERPYGNLFIKKLNLNEDFYSIDSPQNTVEKHVTIIKEANFPNLLVLAAHSGEGNIAYFENLDNLKVNDEVIISHNNKKYHYYVKEIGEEKKDGYINLNRDTNNQLVLTTCSPNHNGYQLVINCIEKESN